MRSGSFQAGALARAGCGHIVIIDRDYVELSNLQRQWLFEEADAAESLPKAVAAVRRLEKINSAVKATPVIADLTPSNIDELLGEVDLVLDGTDNFETRFLINDFCVSRDIPWVYGAAVGSYGIVMPVLANRAPCLRCIYPKAPGGLAADLRDGWSPEHHHVFDRFAPGDGGHQDSLRATGLTPHYLSGRLDRPDSPDRVTPPRSRL